MIWAIYILMLASIVITGIEAYKKFKKGDDYKPLFWGTIITFLILSLTITQDRYDALKFSEQVTKTAEANERASDNKKVIQGLKVENNKLLKNIKIIEKEIANTQKENDSIRIKLSESQVKQRKLEIQAMELERTNYLEKKKRYSNEIMSTENRLIQTHPTYTDLKKHNGINVITAIYDNGEAISTANSLTQIFRYNDWNVLDSFTYFEEEYLQRIPETKQRKQNEGKLNWVHHFPKHGIRICAHGKAYRAAEDLKYHLLATGVYAETENNFFYDNNILNISDSTVYVIVDIKPYNEKQILEEVYLRDKKAIKLRKQFERSIKDRYVSMYQIHKESIEETISASKKAGLNEEEIYKSLELFHGIRLKRDNLNVDLIVRQILEKEYW